MDATHFANLLRSLATTPSRRAVSRALAGSALVGALSPLLGFTEADAKRKKKKRRRRKKKRKKKEPQPFCAGKDFCTDGEAAFCDADGSGQCQCYVTAGTGEPFCGTIPSPFLLCVDCSAAQTCVELELCGSASAGCADPCSNPL